MPGAVAARPLPLGGRDQGAAPAVRALLDAVPAYFSQAVITADRKTATLAFGIRLMPLDDQKRVMDQMAARLDPPHGRDRAARRPAGARRRGQRTRCPRRCAGSARCWPACSRSGSRCSRSTGAGSARGSRSCRSRSPPAGRRSCCSPLRVPLNPMSATLGALVIAISTEFSVLLTARYREERAAGHAPARRAAAHLPLDRHGGDRVGHHRDRGLRGARAVGHPDALGLRARHGRRPLRLAARRARRAARRADAGRAARHAARRRRRRRRRCRSRPIPA